MTATGRRLRLAAAVAGIALIVAGSLWGSDADFPFGPFRMYATAARANGRVSTAALVGTTTTGREVDLHAGDVGLRRADLEGQLRRVQQDPDLLADLARAYNRHHDRRHRLTALRVDLRSHLIRNGRSAGARRHVTIAVWQARP